RAQLLIPLPPTTDGRDKKSWGKSYNIMTEENLNRLLPLLCENSYVPIYHISLYYKGFAYKYA
ncbi:hypothetical protein, partial [Bacteroides acidifaciens]|uniref:hypothetical protein n=1 Tax=Bacteroides acidifaciens TaxID=85831 RepID=UPI0025884959